jgi:hypothetical protein
MTTTTQTAAPQQTKTMTRFLRHLEWAATMKRGGDQRQVELRAATACINYLEGHEKLTARYLLRDAKA